MSGKQLLFLLAALLVIGSAGLVLIHRHKESWNVTEARMGDKVLPDFQPNAVAAIHIQGSTAELNLVHQDGVWRVRERHDYPANFHQISDLLIKLKELKVVEADIVDAPDLARVNLNEPGAGVGAGTLVEFRDAQGKVLDSLLVGKKHTRAPDDSSHSPFLGSQSDGCYILLPGDPKDVLLISDPLASLQPSPALWLSKDFFKVERVQSISLANAWTITRQTESSPWTLADAQPGETLPTNKLAPVINALAAPRFSDVLPADAGLDQARVVTLRTFDRFTYTVKVGGRAPDGNYYLTVAVAADAPADGKLREKLQQEQALAGWTYVVGAWILDPLLRDRGQLLRGDNK